MYNLGVSISLCVYTRPTMPEERVVSTRPGLISSWELLM